MLNEIVDGNKDFQLKELCKSIDLLLSKKNSVIIAVEGGSASGKTTLGKELEKHYGCNVLHMDDFFLQSKQRTKERLSEPGGNVDRERFKEEVVASLEKAEVIEYRRFDCSTLSLQPARIIIPNKLTVVEGVYSTHPEFGKYYDLAVFMDISPDLQRERIGKRNTLKQAKRFFEEWIPMEQKYFKTMNIKEKCNIIVTVHS